MIKRKIKTEYIILGIVMISLFIYLLLRNPDQVQYEIPEVNQLEESEIEKIEIIKPVESLILIKKDKKWFIQPQEYPADQDKVQKIAKSICQLILTDVISESKNYFKYGLDEENKIIVKASNAQQLLREFEIGKEAATYRHTFVKIPKDSRVFHAQNSFRSDFELKVADLRDKTVLKFDKNEINEIEMNTGETKMVFQKKLREVKIQSSDIKDKTKKTSPDIPLEKPREEFWSMPDGKIGKKAELNAIVSFLSNLKCYDYIQNKTKADFKKPLYSLVLKGVKDYNLYIYRKSDEKDSEYPAVSSENAYPFRLSTYSAERVMKKLEDLIQKPKKQ